MSRRVPSVGTLHPGWLLRLLFCHILFARLERWLPPYDSSYLCHLAPSSLEVVHDVPPGSSCLLWPAPACASKAIKTPSSVLCECVCIVCVCVCVYLSWLAGV